MNVCCYFAIILSLIVSASCIMFHLEPNAHKCLKEELQQNVLVTGEFEVSEAPGQKVDYVVSVVIAITYLFI